MRVVPTDVSGSDGSVAGTRPTKSGCASRHDLAAHSLADGVFSPIIAWLSGEANVLRRTWR